MHPEDFQIFLKLADGSFHPLVSANGKRRQKLTITTAHEAQEKAVFEFYVKYQPKDFASAREMSVADNRVSVLELDLTGADDGPRDLSLSVELDLFDNLSLSVADSVSGSLRTTEVSLSEWLMLKESSSGNYDLPSNRRISPLRIVFLILFVLIGIGLVLFCVWFLAARLSSPPPPPLAELFPVVVSEWLL